jgi:hypothetical protein
MWMNPSCLSSITRIAAVALFAGLATAGASAVELCSNKAGVPVGYKERAAPYFSQAANSKVYAVGAERNTCWVMASPLGGFSIEESAVLTDKPSIASAYIVWGVDVARMKKSLNLKDPAAFCAALRAQVTSTWARRYSDGTVATVNSNGYCIFSDGSMADIGALVIHSGETLMRKLITSNTAFPGYDSLPYIMGPTLR